MRELPADVYQQFQDHCRMAYEGILTGQQISSIFTGVATSVEGASSMSDMLEHNTPLEDLHLCDD